MRGKGKKFPITFQQLMIRLSREIKSKTLQDNPDKKSRGKNDTPNIFVFAISDQVRMLKDKYRTLTVNTIRIEKLVQKFR